MGWGRQRAWVLLIDRRLLLPEVVSPTAATAASATPVCGDGPPVVNL